MSKQLVVHKGRVNVVAANLQMDISGATITSQIRERPEQDSPLIATWTVTVTDATTGKLSLFLDDAPNVIVQAKGFMDILRVTGGQPVSVFDEPLAVEFRGTVTV